MARVNIGSRPPERIKAELFDQCTGAERRWKLYPQKASIER